MRIFIGKTDGIKQIQKEIKKMKDKFPSMFPKLHAGKIPNKQPENAESY